VSISRTGSPQARRVADAVHEAEVLFRGLTGEIRRATALAGRAQRKARELLTDVEFQHELDARTRTGSERW
jgi:hypothetical protein